MNQNISIFHSTLDADGSGYLDLREFLLAMQLVGARSPEDKLEWAFRQYDGDNSGELDQKEMSLAYKSIYQMLNSIGVIPSGDPAEKAEVIFREIDINHDGFLTLDEFLRGCRKDEELMSLLDKLFEYLTKEAEAAEENNEATGPWRYVKNNKKNMVKANKCNLDPTGLNNQKDIPIIKTNFSSVESLEQSRCLPKCPNLPYSKSNKIDLEQVMAG